MSSGSQVICCVLDAKAEIYQKWFFADTAALAIRIFSDAARTEGTPINDHPEDFTLWLSGSVDEGAGMVDGLETPTCIARAIDIVKKETE